MNHGDRGPPQQAAASRLARTGARATIETAGRHPWVLAMVAVTLVVLALLAMVTVAVLLALSPPADPATLQRALPTLSPVVLAAYLDASARADELAPGCAVRAAVVAAIGAVESAHATLDGATVDEQTGVVSPPILGPRLDGSLPGTRVVLDSDRGVLDGDTEFDRAVGPMQFLPSSWARFGVDGDGDGRADPHNIYDAAAAAVVHLCRVPGPPTDLDADPAALRAAILGYNASEVYADRVLSLTASYDLLLGSDGLVMVGADPAALLAHPGFSASPNAAQDLVSGTVDPRVVDLLTVVASRWPIHVSVLRTGHSQCVGGQSRQTRPDCRESHHWHGRGADISTVAGRRVDPSNEAALELVAWLATLPADSGLRPSEVGSPWPEFTPLPGFFSDDAHLGHVHLAVCGPRWIGATWEEPGC